MTKKQIDSAKSAAAPGVSYQALRVELDAVLARLQDPAGDVDDAVAQYEQAMRLTTKIEAYLEEAENRIKKIEADFSASSRESDALS